MAEEKLTSNNIGNDTGDISYRTIREFCTGEVVEKKSRFIGELFPITSEKEAEEILSEARSKGLANQSKIVAEAKEEAARLAKEEKDVLFGGRLGTYSYLDMDQVIASAMDLWEKESIK